MSGVLGQLGDFPAKAFDALIATMATVVECTSQRSTNFGRVSG